MFKMDNKLELKIKECQLEDSSILLVTWLQS